MPVQKNSKKVQSKICRWIIQGRKRRCEDTHCEDNLFALQREMAQKSTQTVVAQFFGVPESGKSKLISELKKICDRSKKTVCVICDTLVTNKDLTAMSYGKNHFAVQTQILDRVEKELLFDPKNYDYIFIHTPLDMLELFILSKHLSKDLTEYEFQYLKTRIEKLQNIVPLVRMNIALFTDAKVFTKNYQLECLLDNFLRKRDIYCLTNATCQDAQEMAEDIFQHLEKGWNHCTDLL